MTERTSTSPSPGAAARSRRRLLPATIVAVALLAGCVDGDDPPTDDDATAGTEPGSQEPEEDEQEPVEEDEQEPEEDEPASDEPDEQPLPTTTWEVFELDELLTEYEVRVAEIIIEFDGQVTDEGTVLTLEEPILFEFDSDVLKDTARDALDDITEVLDHYADAPIEVIGHTDDVGSADYNLDLSQRRAEAVVAGLTDRGIDSGRIAAEGRGLTEPVATNDTEEGRAQNRRVEVLIVGVEPPEPDHD